MYHMYPALFCSSTSTPQPCGARCAAAMLSVVCSAIHHNVLLRDLWHVADLACLTAVPLGVLGVLAPRGSLSWLGLYRNELEVNRYRTLLVTLTVLVLAGFAEIRIIFHSYSAYIHLPAPWSYVLVTVCVYSVAVFSLLHFNGSLRESTSSAIIGTFACISGSSFSVVIGAPMTMLPLLLAAAFFIARFYMARCASSAVYSTLEPGPQNPVLGYFGIG